MPLHQSGNYCFCPPLRKGHVVVQLPNVISMPNNVELELRIPAQQFVDLYQREGKRGTMTFMVFDTIHKNQKSETVAKSSGTIIGFD